MRRPHRERLHVEVEPVSVAMRESIHEPIPQVLAENRKPCQTTDNGLNENAARSGIKVGENRMHDRSLTVSPACSPYDRRAIDTHLFDVSRMLKELESLHKMTRQVPSGCVRHCAMSLLS